MMNQLLRHRIFRFVIPLIGTAVLMVVATPAFAAGGSGNPWMDFLYKAINLLVLVGVIGYFARKPVSAFFRSSAKEQRDDYHSVREESERIARELAEHKDKLTQLEAELKRMTEDARTDAEAERQQMEADAKANGERIKAHTTHQVEQEMRKARAQLQIQLADETAKLAEQMIRDKMDDKKQQSLVKEFTDQLEANQ